MFQRMSEVKFPKHRGHMLGRPLQGIRVHECRAVAPQGFYELAAKGVVFVGLIASPAIDGALEVAGFEKSSHEKILANGSSCRWFGRVVPSPPVS